jgi:RNase P/RNase MRP subunit p29
MSTPTHLPLRLSRVEREALAGEILGAAVTVRSAPGLARGLEGTLVDESLSTFVIRPAGSSRLLRVPKNGVEGSIALPAGELPLRGELLRVRPEDRTKRLLALGPRRLR